MVGKTHTHTGEGGDGVLRIEVHTQDVFISADSKSGSN